MPFIFQAGGRVNDTSDYGKIVRDQVVDALMTNQGERVFRPRYGVDAQSALFDPRDELVRRDAAAIIKGRLESMVPRCVVKTVDVRAPGPTSQLYVYVRYRPSSMATDVEITVPVSSSEFYARSLSDL